MAVSEAIYGSTTSYVSSSAYYGFVPQNNLQPVNCGGWDGVNVVNMKKETRNGNCCHGAMETDDDSRDAALVNNYCVIPEALRGINTAVYYPSLDDPRYSESLRFGASLDRQPRQDAAAHRRNRKRNNDGELLFVESDQFKKLRKGSGNGRANHAGGFANDRRLAEMRCKSSRSRVSGEYKDCEEEKLAATDSCCWAAGNDSLIVKRDNKRKELLNGNSKLVQNDNSDYEKMLLETHGCSVYHYQRLQLQNGIAEAEF